MTTVSFIVKMDEGLKNDFEKICDSFGISTNSAINLFATAVVNNRHGLIEIMNKSRTREESRELFETARARVLSKYPDGMTLDRINEIIDETGKSD